MDLDGSLTERQINKVFEGVEARYMDVITEVCVLI